MWSTPSGPLCRPPAPPSCARHGQDRQGPSALRERNVTRAEAELTAIGVAAGAECVQPAQHSRWCLSSGDACNRARQPRRADLGLAAGARRARRGRHAARLLRRPRLPRPRGKRGGRGRAAGAAGRRRARARARRRARGGRGAVRRTVAAALCGQRGGRRGGERRPRCAGTRRRRRTAHLQRRCGGACRSTATACPACTGPERLPPPHRSPIREGSGYAAAEQHGRRACRSPETPAA